jgi:hypothetical protein
MRGHDNAARSKLLINDRELILKSLYGPRQTVMPEPEQPGCGPLRLSACFG